MLGEPSTKAPSWRRLDWDSDFFGVSIGRLNITSGAGRKEIEAAAQEARSTGLVCLYIEVPFGSSPAVALSQMSGTVLTDLKTTLAKPIRPDEVLPLESGVRLGARPEDRRKLEEVAEQIALKSRFRFDPGFGEAASRRLYREWLRRSLDEGYADEILVSERDGEATGFITMSYKPEKPAIVLFGVQASERGRGWGGHLIRTAASRAAAKGAERLYVVTQGHNIEALRAYIRNGFNITRAYLFFHLWLEKV